tara:strand:- start:726 stop:1559 length:834 start_codon:yes stop_codon:yes gene_type:complete
MSNYPKTDFNNYMIERHSIYERRAEGQAYPWTDDLILKEYSFCNVYRELDRVTIWIRENWREPYADHPNLPFAMAMARQINWPETLEDIGFPEHWNPSRVKAIMQGRMDRKEKVYTGAYMLTGTLGGTKVEQTVDKILTPLYESPPRIIPNSLEETWKRYLPYPGFSGFMAYEVVTDLRHTKHLENAEDIMTWANPGPGAKRGLNRIHRRPLEKSIPKSQLISEMRELLELCNMAPLPLEMRDIEHCLCEFDKYERVRLGQGKPRAKYKPKLQEELL